MLTRYLGRALTLLGFALLPTGTVTAGCGLSPSGLGAIDTSSDGGAPIDVMTAAADGSSAKGDAVAPAPDGLAEPPANEGGGAQNGPDGGPSTDGPSGPLDATTDQGGTSLPDAGPLQCLGAGDCTPPLVCCGFLSGQQAASSCMASCGGPDQAVVCLPDGGAAQCPPDAGPCTSANASDWNAPQGTGTCGGACPGGC